MFIGQSSHEKITPLYLHICNILFVDRAGGKGSVLWEDEIKARGGGANGDVSIDIGGAGAHFQDQMQMIEDQVGIMVLLIE